MLRYINHSIVIYLNQLFEYLNFTHSNKKKPAYSYFLELLTYIELCFLPHKKILPRL